MAAEQLTLIWESELIREGAGVVRVVARRPLSHMSVKQAARILDCSEWTVLKIYRNGLLRGFKPGAVKMRRDGRGSNACLRLDSESVLSYKARQQAAALKEQGAMAS